MKGTSLGYDYAARSNPFQENEVVSSHQRKVRESEVKEAVRLRSCR